MKKVLSVLLASATALTAMGGLTACGGDSKTITVWAPTAAIAGYKSLVSDFKKDYPEYAEWDISFTPVDEGEAATKLNTDASSGADIFFFEAGQIQNLADKNVLRNLGESYTSEIKARDEENWYKWVLDDETGNALAFPTTSDNGWFLWYDSSFYTDPSEVATLDAMLAKAKSANKNVLFKYNDGWYIPTFWFGMGCKMDYEGTTYVTDVNSDKGKIAAQSAYNYLSPSKNLMKNQKACIISNSDMNSAVGTGFQDGSVVAAFQGTWIAKDIESKMETATGGRTYEDIKCVKCPTFTAGDEQVQMGSFMAGKYCGVNAKKSGGNIQLSMAFANYMTNERGQTVRYETSNAGPTNIKVLALDAVKNDKAIQAVRAQQAAGGYTQLAQSSQFWTSWETFGNGIYSGTTKPTMLMSELDKLAEAIKK